MNRFSLLFVLLAACTKDDPIDSSLPDLDGDGYDIASDCDDADAAVNPDADEVCDGIDNNCDAVVDEGVKLTSFADLDGDGHRDGETSSEDCQVPSGYVEGDGDCDDAEDTVYPGAPRSVMGS